MGSQARDSKGMPSSTEPRDLITLEAIGCSTSAGQAFLTPVTIATAPKTLVSFLSSCFNAEVDAADTYPHNQHMNDEEFAPYWFGHTAIILLKESSSLNEDREWASELLGTYYIKPNYIGHCSHICNAGFIVPKPHRGGKFRDGKVLAASFPYFATQLKYRSSVFNLVFESNKASMRLWDQAGYRRTGRIEEAINIKGDWVAAIVYQGNFLNGSIKTSFP